MMRAFRIKVSAVLLMAGWLLLGMSAFAQNPTQLENAKAGATDWPLANPATNHEIEGYASLTSVNRGGQISLFVSTTDPSYTMDIYRMGWYGGDGGRRMLSTITLTGQLQTTPAPDPVTGIVDCNWTNPYVLSIPYDPNDATNWASGFYLVKLTGTVSGKQSYIIFVVRDDARISNFLFQSSVTTYQAYNAWGGKSLYSYDSIGGSVDDEEGGSNVGAAVMVSFNRPYGTGTVSTAFPGIGAGDFFTTNNTTSTSFSAGWEYNTVRWMEEQGYDVTYCTDIDTHEQPNLLLTHAAFLSVGHDEYWSAQMRATVLNGRDHGVNIAFLAANVSYWQIRLQPSTVTGAVDRTIVCYKTSSDPIQGTLETINWRDIGLPEAAFIGVEYFYSPLDGNIVVTDASHWVFAGTGLANTNTLNNLLGYEVDQITTDSPGNTISLANSPAVATCCGIDGNADVSIYQALSGAYVFATGSMQWNWGLDDYGAPNARPFAFNSAAQQITMNVFAKFTTPAITLSPAQIALSASQTQQFTATIIGTTNKAVVWSLSPSLGTLSNTGLYTAPSTVTLAQTITITATSVANSTQVATASVILQPVGAMSAIRIVAGGLAYTDSLGQNWAADMDFTGGSTASTTRSIANTADPTLYQTERNGAFTYTASVPNGSYTVTLKFAEIYYTTPGSRIFNVDINGSPVLANFDIVAQAGTAFTALDRTFSVSVTGGTLSIQFITGSADLPKVSAIQIVQSGLGVQVSPASVTLTGGGTQQFTATVSGTTYTGVNWSLSPAVGTVSATGLYTAPSSITAIQTVSVIATSQANTAFSASSTVTLQPAGAISPTRVDSGGAAYTDSQGNAWSADTGFSAGSTGSTTHAISNTSDPTLYQTERYGAFNYVFTVPNGSYNVTLKFAEIYYTTAGSRIFNVAINGTSVLANFDIVAQAGAAFTALDKTFAVTVSGGSITIQFTAGSADLPKISAVQIVQTGIGVGVQVSPTSATLSASQTQQFAATVTGTTNTAVNWSLSPAVGTLSAAGLYTAPSSITASQNVSVIATSQANTSVSSSSTVTLQPPAGSFATIRVNGGGPAYTDSQGNLWSADTGFSGGSTGSTTHAIANTSDPTLYQTERYGPFTYTFTVPNGSYNVTLKFAEIYYTTPGSRIFNVAINGTSVLANFDIVAQAGAAFTALDEVFPVTVTNGSVSIQFTTGPDDLPKISAVQIAQTTVGVGVQVSPTSTTLTASQTQQFTPTVTGTTNTAVNWSLSPAVGTVSAAGLYTAPSSITASQNVSVIATSQANTSVSSSSTVTLQPPAGSFATIRVNGGGPAYTDSQGNDWSADTGFSAGSTGSTTHAISSTSDPTLYQTERYGAFNYVFTVPNGSYIVTLKFAEIYYTTAGSRIFNVAINGTSVLANFDIVAQAGAAFTALDKTFAVTATAGSITIQFTTGSADLPKISAIQIAQTGVGLGVQVSPTSATLTASQTQQFTATLTGTTNTAVNWSLSPAAVGTLSAAGLYTAPSSITASQTVSVIATSQANTTVSSSSTVTLQAPFSTIRVNGGGPAYTDSQGNAWSADTGFSGGSTGSTTHTIANTPDPTLYQTERYGAFTYTFTVPNGSHTVTLKFAEIYYTTPGSRIFNVAINGSSVLANFDIVAQAGAAFTALDEVFPVTVTNGSVSIQFTTGPDDLPKISAIEIQ